MSETAVNFSNKVAAPEIYHREYFVLDKNVGKLEYIMLFLPRNIIL